MYLYLDFLCRGQLQQRDRREHRNQRLQVAVHSRHVEGDRVDLLRAARPLALGRAAFLIEVRTQRGERFDNRLDALAELDTRQVAVEELELLLFRTGRVARPREREQGAAQVRLGTT